MFLGGVPQIQSGWRLEYCAAAEISTFCPDDFDEFFKQRRRWLPSTLANQILLLTQWRQTISRFNKQISNLFLVYQALLLFSTLLNPAVSILVIVGELAENNRRCHWSAVEKLNIHEMVN